MSVWTLIFAILTINHSGLVPKSLEQLLRYGKTSKKIRDPIKKIKLLEVPKMWFYHFYLFASVFYCILSLSVFKVYILKTKVPDFIEIFLDTFVGKHRIASVSVESVILAMILINIHVLRRLYECTQLCIISADGKFHLFSYLMGYAFYLSVGLSLLAEAPVFANTIGMTEVDIKLSNFLSYNHLIGIIVFGISCLIHLKSLSIFANLRKDSKGRIVNYKHTIPRGFLFEWLSCPHYFAEIVIYLSISLVLNCQSITWWSVCFFTFSTMTILDLFSHHWYFDNFKDYPKSRKAVIPFLI